jgi:hypothetical protein
VVFRRHRSCGTLRCHAHPLVSFDLLQSSFRQSPARPLACPSSFRGVLALFATSTRGVHSSTGHPSPTVFRPQRFARSRRLAPPRALRVCFTALPCPGFRSKGLLPPSEPYHLVGGLDLRAVGGVRLPVARRQRTTRRPRGLALVQSPQCPTRLFTPPAPVSLPAFFQTPSGVSRRPGPCHRTSSARGLDGAVLRVPRTVTLSVSISPACFASVPRGCSRSSFAAFESVAQLARPISS